MKLETIYKGYSIGHLLSGWFSAILNGEYVKTATLKEMKLKIDAICK